MIDQLLDFEIAQAALSVLRIYCYCSSFSHDHYFVFYFTDISNKKGNKAGYFSSDDFHVYFNTVSKTSSTILRF